jgi:peptide/nickel transport system substrate-binding protein
VLRRDLLHLTVLGGAAALLQACGPTTPAAPAPAPPTAAPAVAPTAPAVAPAATTAPPPQPTGAAKPGVAGGTLTPAWGASLTSVNPFQAVNPWQAQYFATVFSQLLLASPDKTKMDPELATVTPAADATSYTFKLDPKARWHDGQPLTTADVEWTYTMALNKATKSNRVSRLSLIKGGADYTAGTADTVVGIVVLDPQTIRFDQEFPNALFPLEADLPILPKHLLGTVKPDELERQAQMFDAPVGSGPFTAVKNLADQFSEVAANPDFYRGKPKLDRMVFRIISTEDAMAIGLERGEVDFTASPQLIRTPDTLNRLLGVNQLFVHRMPNAVSASFGFNLRMDHWKSKQVRQAFAYAIDRKKIVDSLLGGNAEIVNSPMRHPWIGFKPKNDYAYNPDMARKLLTDGGWDPNREILVSGTPATSDTERSIRAAIQAQLAAAGIKSKWEELETSVWVAKFYNDHTHDAVFIGATNFGDPHQFLDFHFTTTSRNGPGYASPALDQLVDQGRRSRSQQERAPIYRTIGDLLNEDQPWIWLWSVGDTYVFNRRVRIPFIPVPASTPKTIAEVPFLTIQTAGVTWFSRPEEWAVSA